MEVVEIVQLLGELSECDDECCAGDVSESIWRLMKTGQIIYRRMVDDISEVGGYDYK